MIRHYRIWTDVQQSLARIVSDCPECRRGACAKARAAMTHLVRILESERAELFAEIDRLAEQRAQAESEAKQGDLLGELGGEGGR